MNTYRVTITQKHAPAYESAGVMDFEARTAAEAIKKARRWMDTESGYVRSDGPFYYKAKKI